MSLLLFSDMIFFAECSFNFITCTNLPVYVAFSFSTATIGLDGKPTLHSSVPSWTWIAFIASSGMVSSSATSFHLPLPSIIDNLKWRMSLVTTTIPHQLCWPQDFSFPEALRPKTLILHAVIIVGCCSAHKRKCCIFCIHNLFWVPSAIYTTGRVRTTGTLRLWVLWYSVARGSQFWKD